MHPECTKYLKQEYDQKTGGILALNLYILCEVCGIPVLNTADVEWDEVMIHLDHNIFRCLEAIDMVALDANTYTIYFFHGNQACQVTMRQVSTETLYIKQEDFIPSFIEAYTKPEVYKKIEAKIRNKEEIL